MSTLNTHIDAIELLRHAGIAASRRDWELGDTVVVPLGRPSTHEGVAVYASVAWLVPSESGWRFEQSVAQAARTLRFPDLRAACDLALRIARSFSPTQSCPDCRQPAALDFGERATPHGVAFWVAVRCSQCVAQSESDGIGCLPEDLREMELLGHGFWIVCVNPPATTAQWKVLQDLLQLSLSALTKLKHTLPGKILSGTAVETQHIHNVLLREGLTAALELAGQGQLHGQR